MSKLVSLSDDVYGLLKSLKRGGDSFSDVVVRLVGAGKKRSLADFFGRWPGGPSEAKRIAKTLAEERRQWHTREVRL